MLMCTVMSLKLKEYQTRRQIMGNECNNIGAAFSALNIALRETVCVM